MCTGKKRSGPNLRVEDVLSHSAECRLEYLNTPRLDRVDEEVAPPSVLHLELVLKLVGGGGVFR